MPESTSWLRRTAAFAAAALISVSGPLALSGTANAGTTETGKAADVPVTDIDITSLEEGPTTTEPYAADGKVHIGQQTHDFGLSTVHSVYPVEDGSTLVTLTTHEAEDRVIEIDQDGHVSVLAKGVGLSENLAINGDGSSIAWSSWDSFDDNGNPTDDTTVVEYDREYDQIGGKQTVQDAILQPAAEWDGTKVFEDDESTDTYGWKSPSEKPQKLSAGKTFSATGEEYAAKVQGIDNPQTTIVDDQGKELWSTTKYRIKAISSEDRYAIAVDAEADGLGATSYTVLDVRTGEPESKFKTDLTTQVTAGANSDQFVFDASNDGKQALVQVMPNTDAEPTLVEGAGPADWPNPPENKPYTLSQR